MEFSATLPIDLDALAAAVPRPFAAAAGPDPPPGAAPQEAEFAEALETTLNAGGEILPLAGSLLPLPAPLERPPPAGVAPPASSEWTALSPATAATATKEAAAEVLSRAAGLAVATQVSSPTAEVSAAKLALALPAPAAAAAAGETATQRLPPSPQQAPVIRALALPSAGPTEALPAAVPAPAQATASADEHPVRPSPPARSASADETQPRSRTPPVLELGDLRSSAATADTPRPTTAPAAGALAPIADVTLPSPARPGTLLGADALPVDVGHRDAADVLGARIQWLADRNVGEARIRLNPPELGLLDIKLTVVDDETFVQLTAQLPAAREALEGQIPRLREMLALGGLTLGGATVTGGERESRGGAAADPVVVVPVEPPPIELEAPTVARARASRIDLFA